MRSPSPIRSRPRSVACRAASSLTMRAYSRYFSNAGLSRTASCAAWSPFSAAPTSPLAARTACWTSAIVSGFHMWCSPSRRHA